MADGGKNKRHDAGKEVEGHAHGIRGNTDETDATVPRLSAWYAKLSSETTTVIVVL